VQGKDAEAGLLSTEAAGIREAALGLMIRTSPNIAGQPRGADAGSRSHVPRVTLPQNFAGTAGWDIHLAISGGID
jgi:hypothetical protein